jgi:hypothetical protein
MHTRDPQVLGRAGDPEPPGVAPGANTVQISTTAQMAYHVGRGNRTYRDHQGKTQVQGPPVTCGLSQFTGHLWTYESLAGGNKRRLFAMDAHLTRGTVSRPPFAPCTTCLHHVCMVTWDLRSTS